MVFSAQDLSTLEEHTQVDEGGTLTAIGRALLQMQQGNHQNQQPQVSPSSNQQIFFTRASESDTGSQSGKPSLVVSQSLQACEPYGTLVRLLPLHHPLSVP